MWKWLNPWRELRQAREQIALLEAECDALDREARDARRVAYAEAHEHYEMRTKALRSEEHTSELQSLMRISYAVFCLKNKISSLLTTLFSIFLSFFTIHLISLLFTLHSFLS